MVLKRRQECGFNTFQFAFVPRAPRSARRRVLHKKKVEDTQICAFEVLASLAGKLLQESESSSASSIASGSNDQPAIGDDIFKQDQGEYKPLRTECIDQGSYDESVFVPEFTSGNGEQKFLLKESPHAESDSIMEHSSAITNSGSSDKPSNDVKSMTYKSSNPCENIPCKSEGGSLVPGENGYVTNGFIGRRDVDGVETGNLTTDNKLSSKVPMESCTEFHALVNTDNKVKLPSCRDPVPNASILRHRNGCKLGIRDDDEKFSRCNNQPRVFRHPSRIGDRRIRKLLTSKYWKVSPKLKDYELSNVDGVKPLYRKRKIGYSRGRYQHDTFYKRRKFSNNSLVVNSDGGLSSESVCNSPQKENGISSSTIGRQASFNSRDSHVRFSIKSFRIPELFIEVPDDTTVGFLKRRVLETVTAILGGSLRVGVVFHGKKVRDDNRTLLQSGITSKDNLDTLGFTLEPSPGQTPLTVCPEDPPVPISCDTSQIVLRSPTAPVLDPGVPDATPDPPPLTNLGDKFDCNHESTPPVADKLTDKTVSDSRALVAVPPASVDALAVVPLNQKTKRSELVQRRTRRPFSVSEVEALVQAVEELGTGRWRDVKLRSFENADHRTYVDLKDKWKTLVHTAKIAPQQRRGEPVPQELLDRVLAAHAYWSRQQAKQHSKSQAQAAAALKISDSDVGGGNGVEGITM